MIHSTTPIEVLSEVAIADRSEAGLIVPTHAQEGLRVVDCSDDRGLTPDFYNLRSETYGHEVSPGRYFGAVSGLATAALIGFAAEHGERAVSGFIRDYTPEGFVDFASDLSDRANKLSDPIALNQHSDDSKEMNPVELANHKVCDNPLGCAFAIKLGFVLLGATGEWQTTEAKRVASEVGEELPLEVASEGISILQRHIPKEFGIHRGALHFAQTKTARHTPVAIHQGHHAPNDKAGLVIDFAGYRSNANRHNDAELPRYHHTPGLAVDVLSALMPEIKLDPNILKAAGLLLGTSTRLALSGAETPSALKIEIIPAERRAA